MHTERPKRRLVHADAISLLSLGVQLTYILGFLTYSLGERGWPGWLRAYLPTWLGPVDVLFALPSVALFACGVSLLMAEREVSHRSTTDARIPWLCWASLVGIVGVLVFNAVVAVTFRQFFLLTQSIPFAVAAFAPLTAFIVSRLMRRRDRPAKKNVSG